MRSLFDAMVVILYDVSVDFFLQTSLIDITPWGLVFCS